MLVDRCLNLIPRSTQDASACNIVIDEYETFANISACNVLRSEYLGFYSTQSQL